MGNGKPCKTLEKLLSKAKFVLSHVPKSNSTASMMGTEQIAMMQDGVYLLNASRGSVVHFDPVASATKSGHLAVRRWMCFRSNRRRICQASKHLFSDYRAILTPHVTGSTVETQKSIGDEVARTLTKFVNQKRTAGAIDFSEIDVPHTPGAHRILIAHQNKSRVLGNINSILTQSNLNVHKQMWSTLSHVGCLILDEEASEETKKAILAMKHNIKAITLHYCA